MTDPAKAGLYHIRGYAYPERNIPPNACLSDDQKTAGLYRIGSTAPGYDATFDPATGAIVMMADSMANEGAGNYVVDPAHATDENGRVYANRWDPATGKLDLFLYASLNGGQGNLRVFKEGFADPANGLVAKNTIVRNGSTWTADVIADSSIDAGTRNVKLQTAVDFSAGHLTFLLDSDADGVPGNYTVEIWIDRPVPDVIGQILAQSAPFPTFADDPRRKAAFDFMVQTYCAGQDPRDQYTNDDWSHPSIPGTAPSSWSKDDAKAYGVVWTQLNDEFTFRSEAVNHYRNVHAWLGDLYSGSGFTLADVAEKMNWTTASSQQGTLDFVGIFSTVLGYALADAPAVAAGAQVILSILSTAFAGGQGGGGGGTLNGTLSDLEDQLTARFDSLQDASATQLQEIVGNWGKLQAFGLAELNHTIGWDAVTARTLLKAARKTYARQVFEQLARSAWTLNQGPVYFTIGAGTLYPTQFEKDGMQYEESPDGATSWAAQIVLQSDTSKRIDHKAILAWMDEQKFGIDAYKLFNLNVLQLPTNWVEGYFPSR